MRALHLRTAAILLAAGVGLGGCATYSPFGYGSGLSVSYGDRYYDPYRGYAAGYAPYGWYDGFYYPGAGYYVYDRYRRPYYWNDYQRRYWTVRQKDPSVREVWTDFARRHATRSGTTSQTQSVTTSAEPVRTQRVERVRPSRAERSERKSSLSDRVRTRIGERRAAKKD
jgi:hypothetical protein